MLSYNVCLLLCSFCILYYNKYESYTAVVLFLCFIDMYSLQNHLKNVSFRNKENLHYKITADSVLLSLFMRTNGKCNNSQAH